MIPAFVEILRSGEPVFHKDSMDYQFRRVLLDILHRIPLNETMRAQSVTLVQGMLHIIRHDNEENGIASCKVIADILRTFRTLTEDLVVDSIATFQDALRNMKGVVDELLSETSTLPNSNTLLPAMRSFKVLAEMGMVVMHFSQAHRALMISNIQASLPLYFEVLAVESPAQKKAREDYEAMGNYWTGMASTILNTSAYTEFHNAQTKV
jgi:transformation/transcription domain-associated protein